MPKATFTGYCAHCRRGIIAHRTHITWMLAVASGRAVPIHSKPCRNELLRLGWMDQPVRRAGVKDEAPCPACGRTIYPKTPVLDYTFRLPGEADRTIRSHIQCRRTIDTMLTTNAMLGPRGRPLRVRIREATA